MNLREFSSHFPVKLLESIHFDRQVEQRPGLADYISLSLEGRSYWTNSSPLLSEKCSFRLEAWRASDWTYTPCS